VTTVASRVSHHDENILEFIIITSINQSINQSHPGLDGTIPSGDVHDTKIHL